jgi:hypothetical protein
VVERLPDPVIVVPKPPAPEFRTPPAPAPIVSRFASAAVVVESEPGEPPAPAPRPVAREDEAGEPADHRSLAEMFHILTKDPEPEPEPVVEPDPEPVHEPEPEPEPEPVAMASVEPPADEEPGLFRRL